MYHGYSYQNFGGIKKTNNNDTINIVEAASSLSKFKKIYIIFWITSLFGYYVEIIWSLLNIYVFKISNWRPVDLTFIPVTVPYGLGVIAVILFVIPLIKRYKLHPAVVFIVSALITGAIEYVSATVIVMIYGRNEYWDYSKKFLNINGYVCLRNVLIFGVLSMLYIYYIHPRFMKFYDKHLKIHESSIFWVLYVTNFIDLTYALMR